MEIEPPVMARLRDSIRFDSLQNTAKPCFCTERSVYFPLGSSQYFNVGIVAECLQQIVRGQGKPC